MDHDRTQQTAVGQRLGATALAVALAAAGGGGWLWWSRPERHLAEARHLVESGAPEEAGAWLEVPESMPRTREPALLLRARAALEQGRPSVAVAPLNGVDTGGPNAAEAALLKGRALQAVGQSARAVAWLRRSLELRPDAAEAQRWLAAAAYDLGDRATAVGALRAATRLDSRDARPWRTLALLFKEDSDLESAEAAYRKALELDPKQPQARLEWAEVLVGVGRNAEAERQLRLCRGKVPEPDRAAWLAESLRARGESAAARATLDAALAREHGHPRLNAGRALFDLAEGRPAEAVARLDRSLRADPYQAEWLYLRGLALRRLGRDSDSRRDLDRAGELKRGLAEMSALNDESSRRPEDADVRFRLGELCVRLGKKSLGASWYRAALACDSGHKGARLGLEALRPR